MVRKRKEKTEEEQQKQDVEIKPKVKRSVKTKKTTTEEKPVKKVKKVKIVKKKKAAVDAVAVKDEAPSAPEPVKKVVKKKVKKIVVKHKAVSEHTAVPEHKTVPEKKPVVSPPAVVHKKPAAPEAVAPKEEVVKKDLPKIKINELTTVRELSEKVGKPITEVLKKMLSLGTVATINQRLDQDTCILIAHEFGYDIEFVPLYSEDKTDIKEEKGKLAPRAPVVTVMGHVDHGKTSVLDVIREADVTSREAGGITQHIGAYEVKTPKGDIVFLDTPGHESFTAMRAHGSKITDIVVLVVAADDGIMPQTIEAINHARVANVPIIVAINKMDLPGANSEKVKQQLANYNLIPDDWGGDTFCVEISARDKTNIEKLLETILFKAELLELKTRHDCAAQGVVIEASLDPRKGPLTTILIQRGTLKIGDSFTCGVTSGRVKALLNDKEERIQSANSNIPVEVFGFNKVPLTGERFIVVGNDKVARGIVQKRQNSVRLERMQTRRKISLEDIASGNVKQLNVVLKTDVQGSLDAVCDALDRIHSDEVKLKIVHAGVGAVTISDVNLAISSNAIIIGFNIRPNANSEALAKQEGVDVRTYRIIYELIDEIKKALEGMLSPKFKEVVTGKVQVRKTFKISHTGIVAGCFVLSGKVQRGGYVRLLRDNAIVYDGKIETLRRFKDDAREVDKGHECGIVLENYSDIRVNDVFEVYVKEAVQQTLL